MVKTINQSPTPEEWRTAKEYALTLGDKMMKASEKQAEEKKCDAPPEFVSK